MNGEKIRYARRKLLMSQEELSEKAGVSRAVISKMENGKECNTTSRVMKSIATTLNCTVDELFF